MRGFGARFMGAILLDSSLYEEVEADRSALPQAMGVVILSSVASGVGPLIGWLIWAWLTYFIGTRLLPTPTTSSNWGEMLRTLGFAAAPGCLMVFSFIPFFGIIVAIAVRIWMLVAMVIAVRQALDYQSTWRAVGVCITGWVVFAILGSIVMLAAS